MFEKSGNSKNRSSKSPDNLKAIVKGDSRDQENNSKNWGIRIIRCSKNQGSTVIVFVLYCRLYRELVLVFVFDPGSYFNYFWVFFQWHIQIFWETSRNSRTEVFCKKDVLKNLTNLQENPALESFLINCRASGLQLY